MFPRHGKRKFLSGNKKRLKKKRVEQLIQSQKGALERFMIKESQASVEDVVTEQQNDGELNDNEHLIEEDVKLHLFVLPLLVHIIIRLKEIVVECFSLMNVNFG